ncbi:MAG: tRNA pseudouridine(55) synthase TruB [Phycisphaerae bacterium]|nr:tRNA pseudouridine(55) synthase TruB [Phycisphaerae bacterium]
MTDANKHTASSTDQRPRGAPPSDSPPPLEGIFVVDKPLGMSSFGVVARVRRAAGRAKTGHAGTLDPLASGVLVLAVGKATRAISQLMDTDKQYRTEIDLSAFTTTDDREGERAEIAVPSPPTDDAVRAALATFVGVVQQRPPAFSAMKVDGERAYRLARAGAPPDLPPRPVRIDRVELLRYEWPIVEIAIACGKGTYIRSIARDLGIALGTGGHCATLRRTAVGPFDDRSALQLDRLPNMLTQAELIPTARAIEMVAASRRL